jgi:hypothetical protein
MSPFRASRARARRALSTTARRCRGAGELQGRLAPAPGINDCIAYPTSDSLSEFAAGELADFIPWCGVPTTPTGARDGTRADGVLARRRRRQFSFSLYCFRSAAAASYRVIAAGGRHRHPVWIVAGIFPVLGRPQIAIALPSSTALAFVPRPSFTAFLHQEVHDCQRADAINPPRAGKPLRGETGDNHE